MRAPMVTEPTLVVDLDAFAANLVAVRTRIAPAELMLVVKDDAYGHGLAEIVARASAEGVRWFGAFDVAGALATRAVAGPAARIFSWLTVGTDEITEALGADIELGIGDALFLEDVAAVASASGIAARVHLKIDTGLHRNGIRPEAWPGFVQRARDLEVAGVLRVVGVWSHIAEASDREDDDARGVFDRAIEIAEAAGLVLEHRHLSASAASFARSEFRYDMARVGAFCYGIRSAGGMDEGELGIHPIASLIAPVMSVHGGVATIGVGSLHGLLSRLGGWMDVAAGAQRVRVVSIGLSSSAVSLSAVSLRTVSSSAESSRTESPWSTPSDDTVTVFGPGAHSATDLAEKLDTVGEEILLRVSPLVARRYLGG